MRRRVMITAGAFLLAACGGDDEAGTAINAGGAADGDAEPVVAPVPDPGVVPVGQPIAGGPLQPVNNSGVTGSVSLRDLGGRQTEMTARVTGMPADAPPAVALIVQGTCDAPGTEVARTGPLTAGPADAKTGVDTLSVAASGLVDGAHAVLIKGQDAGPATPPLACSPLPAMTP